MFQISLAQLAADGRLRNQTIQEVQKFCSPQLVRHLERLIDGGKDNGAQVSTIFTQILDNISRFEITHSLVQILVMAYEWFLASAICHCLPLVEHS